jgi:hypothetical protein
MPAVAKTKCDACGGQHEFCLADAGAFKRHAAYGYICPSTNQAAQLVLKARIEKYRTACPEGAVQVNEMAST